MRKILSVSGLRARRRDEEPRNVPEPETVISEGVQLAAEYLGGLPVPASRKEADPGRMRLAVAVGALVAAQGGTAGDAFDALLRTGERALEAGGEAEARLALDLAERATTVRDRSKGAWRLRGLALEALGRDEEAIGAYERHLDLQQSAGAGREIALRVATLKELRACLDEAAALFPGAPAEPALPEGFAGYVESRLTEHGSGDPGVRRLAGLYATHRRLTAQGRLADPLLGGSEPIGVSAFRNAIAGRTVCVVTGAAALAGSGLGAEIDAYDLVIRCDGFRTGPDDTGERTDVHAVTLQGDTPWDGPGWEQRVDTRLVFGESVKDWRQALRRRLVPGAQRHVGNASLRRPVSDPGLIGESGRRQYGTAFSVLRLLDFLDVSPRIDLIGRLRNEESEWVTAHAEHMDPTGLRTALR